MEPTYEVGDRVKVLIERYFIHPETKEEKMWSDYYAGTIITYHELPDPITKEPTVFYKVSVDGIGDIKIAKELEDGSLEMVTNPVQLSAIN